MTLLCLKPLAQDSISIRLSYKKLTEMWEKWGETIMVEFVKLNVSKHLSILIDLNMAYFEWIAKEGENYLNISFESILGSTHSYAAMILDELEIYQPPSGVFYLLKENDDFIGMCALRKLYQDTGEVKGCILNLNIEEKGTGKK